MFTSLGASPWGRVVITQRPHVWLTCKRTDSPMRMVRPIQWFSTNSFLPDGVSRTKLGRNRCTEKLPWRMEFFKSPKRGCRQKMQD